MSTNSTTTFSVADDGSLTETPIPSQPKRTRTSPCSKANCPFCNGPASNHHVCNLTEDLENSIQTSRSNKPTAPADHWITNLTKDFKDAIMDHDIAKMEFLKKRYSKRADEAPDFNQYDRTN